MTFLPIVERELRVAARRPGSYWLRVWVAMLALLTAGSEVVLFSSMPQSRQGSFLFHSLSFVTFLYCLLVGVQLTADCLSREKREGTLGLLFLTDLKGYDVVLGKLVACSLNAVYGLIAVVPVLAMALMMGGVSGGLFVCMILVLLNSLFFSLAVGMVVSTFTRHERVAMVLTFFGLFLVCMVPVAAVLFMFVIVEISPGMRWLGAVGTLSPFYAFGTLSSNMFLFRGPPFWTSLVLVHLMGWVCLAVASLGVPRIWQDRTSNKRPALPLEHEGRHPRQISATATAMRSRSRWLQSNPGLWLVLRDRRKSIYVWGFLGSLSGLWILGCMTYPQMIMNWIVALGTLLMLQGFLKIWMLSEVCSRFVEEKRSGTLEFLLSTPLSVGEWLVGQIQGMRRLFLAPILALLAAEFWLWGALPPRIDYPFGPDPDLRGGWILLAGGITLILDLYLLGWIGIHRGLFARNTNRAIVGSACQVLLLPWIITLGVGLIWGILKVWWAPWLMVRDTLTWVVVIWFGSHMIIVLVSGSFARRRSLQDLRRMASEPVIRRKDRVAGQETTGLTKTSIEPATTAS